MVVNPLTVSVLICTIFCSASKVQNQVSRASFLPTNPREVAQGNILLTCTGDKSIRNKIFWMRNGERVESTDIEKTDTSKIQSIHTLSTYGEAYYRCGGVGLWLVIKKDAKATEETSVWKNSDIRCIDPVPNEEETQYDQYGAEGEEVFIIYKNTGERIEHYPVKQLTVTSDMTIKCNNTGAYKFVAEELPVSNVKFEGKKVICSSSDTTARCNLKLYFGDKLLAEGVSPTLEYHYNKINIQQVYCKSYCTIGNDFRALGVQSIEINRTIYIVVIFFIILIILIIIIIICCVLWHKFGFKEKYGYDINMRLKKNFSVDGNKLSRYRLSGVEADAVEVELDDGTDVNHAPKNIDDGSFVDDDSFVDPNFAKTNQKIDMRSKDDISGQPVNQRPFLRI